MPIKADVGMPEVVGVLDRLGFAQLPPGLEMHEVQPTKFPIKLQDGSVYHLDVPPALGKQFELFWPLYYLSWGNTWYSNVCPGTVS